MAMLDWTLYGNTLESWALALLVAALAFSGLTVVRGLLVRHLAALAERTHNQIDDVAAEVVRRTKGWLLAVGALAIGALRLDLPAGPDGAAGGLAVALRGAVVVALVLQGTIWGNALIDFYVARHGRRLQSEDPAGATTLSALAYLGRLLLLAVLVLVGLENLGVDITALVAGLGIGGIAVALAVQNVLGDLLASLSIVLDRPFVIGDFIVVDDLSGTVEHVGLKTTRVTSLSGEQLIFSNADLLGSRIRNYKRMQERRAAFAVGVTYQTPHAQLAAIPGMIREIVESVEGVRFDRAHLRSFGASSIDFEIVYYVLAPEYNAYMDCQQAINLEIFRRFEAEGIEFAYPTQTLFVQRAEAAPVAAGEPTRSQAPVPAGE